MKKLSLLLVTSIFINLSLLNCKNISSNTKKNTNTQDEKNQFRKFDCFKCKSCN